jgi:hypothetical protein
MKGMLNVIIRAYFLKLLAPPRPAVPFDKLEYEHLDNGSSIDMKPTRKKRKAEAFDNTLPRNTKRDCYQRYLDIHFISNAQKILEYTRIIEDHTKNCTKGSIQLRKRST